MTKQQRIRQALQDLCQQCLCDGTLPVALVVINDDPQEHGGAIYYVDVGTPVEGLAAVLRCCADHLEEGT